MAMKLTMKLNISNSMILSPSLKLNQQ